MIYLIDAGHGGINSKGEYDCLANGKMFNHPDGPVYEGVMNRRIAKILEKMLKEIGIDYLPIYDPVVDTSLTFRIKKVSDVAKTRKDVCVLSIHHNASPNHDAEGLEIFTTKGVTKSDTYATIFGKNMKIDFPDMKYRGFYGGDQYDKEADWKIIKDSEEIFKKNGHTNSGAILFEWGFFDNAKEVKKINTDQYAYRAAESMMRSIKIIEGC